MTSPRITDELLDACEAACRQEHERWSWRRKPDHKPGFELVRETPTRQGDPEIINLTQRECRDRHEVEGWLNTYRGRAAMRAVVAVLAERTIRSRKRDPLRNNPIVGFMSETQAERILAEMKEERR